MGARVLLHLSDGDFFGETLRVGDLNADGGPDLLLVQSEFGTREIRCLTAVGMDGRKLWQWGSPSRDNCRVYSDLPVQVFDWDNDGHNEVLFVKQAVYAKATPFGGYARERAEVYEGEATMIVLDAATGQVKRTFSLPAPADDSFFFADLTGRGWRGDLVVKDRYWNMWGIAHDGRVLWHYEGSVGHCPAIGDADGDGRDEVFVGYALIDHDGKALFQHDAGKSHQDAACIVRMPDGKVRMVFGNGGLRCVTPDGIEAWSHQVGEAQHVVPGRFRTDSPLQFMVILRGQPKPGGGRAPAVLALFDVDGRQLWTRTQPEGSWAANITGINWHGHGRPKCALVFRRAHGQPAAIYDGEGRIVDELPLAPAPPIAESDWISKQYFPPSYHGHAADVWGDGREEAVLFGALGLYVYTNSRPHSEPSLYNETLYAGE